MKLDRDKDAALISRLENWKFGQAMQYLRDDHPKSVHNEVNVLCRLFGDAGWFDGDIGELVRLAVIGLIEGERWSDKS